MKKKKKYTKYEKLHFLHDYKESGLNLSEYCTRNKINYYEMRAWLANYKNKVNDAGTLLETRKNNSNLIVNRNTSNSKINIEEPNFIKEEKSNGMVCFTISEKKKTVLIKNEKNIKLNHYSIEYNEEIYSFSNNINKCCIRLLELQFNKYNEDLLQRLMEVLK